MTVRVDQTILATDPDRPGNCLAACVATFVGKPLDDVPHFIEHGEHMRPNPEEPDRLLWWVMLLGFMAGHGLWPIELGTIDEGEPGELLFVMGMSPRGVCHQVLYRDGVLWHDPHPSRDGIADVREVLAWRPHQHDHQPTVTSEVPHV